MLTLIAHRGTPAEHTENTIPSLRRAEELGADSVEFDVRLTRDGVPVLLHDTDLNRVWQRPDVLAEVDHHTIQDIVPTLADAVDAVNLQLIVDCKGTSTVPRAIAVLAEAGALDRCIFVGQPAELREVRAALPDARLALSWAGDSTPPADLLDALRPEIMNVRWRDLEAATLDTYRAIGRTTWWTYTIDDLKSLRSAIDLGFSGIITNDLPLIRTGVGEGAR